MSLRIRYNRVTTAAGVEPDTITARVGVSFTENAEEGSTGISSLVIDDPNETLDYVGYRRVYGYETTAPAHNQIVFNSYIQDRDIGRGPSEGMDNDEDPLGRRWTINLADTNSLLSRRIITGTDGNRPAETDVTRVQWLLGSNDQYLSNPHDNWTGNYISTASPVQMDAADLRGQTAFDVLNDCAQRSGKNWYARYYENNDTVPPTNAGSYDLWYDFDYSSAFTSSVRLTNVQGEADNISTFYVFPDAMMHRDPTRVYSGQYGTGNGITVYEQSTNVANLFQRRDAAFSNGNITDIAKLRALAQRYLADATTEDDRIKCRFVCAKQYVNDLRQGHRFQAKFSHLATTSGANYATYQYFRVLNRGVTQLTDDFYEIQLEITPIATAPSVLDYVMVSTLSDYVTGTWPHGAPGAGYLAVSMLALRATNDASAYAESATGPGVGDAYVAGTQYSLLTANTISTGAGVYGINLVYRYPTTSADTSYVRWSPSGSLGGSSRPTSHTVLLGGVTTAGTPVSDGSANIPGASTMSSITVHANGPGIIIYGMTYQYPGPGDHVGWGGFTVTANSGTLLGYRYGVGDFAPLSWMAYLSVTTAGDYSISFNLTPPGGEGDPLAAYDVARVGCWFG